MSTPEVVSTEGDNGCGPAGGDPGHEQGAADRRLTRRRALWAFVGAGAALSAVAIGGLIWAVAADLAGRDDHAEAACTALERAEDEFLVDAVITQLKALEEARRSDDAELRAAANKSSAASEIPIDSPLYANPGDIQVRAVRQWCRTHPS